MLSGSGPGSEIKLITCNGFEIILNVIKQLFVTRRVALFSLESY